MSKRDSIALEHLAVQPATPAPQRLHCQIVLACAAGATNAEVAVQLGVTPATVSRWRNRFAREGLRALRPGPRDGAPDGRSGRSGRSGRLDRLKRSRRARRTATAAASAPESAVESAVESAPHRSGNAALATLMREAGLTPTSLARQVRELGRRRGLELRCTHTYVKRWLRGSFGPSVPPELIAAVLTRRLRRVVTPSDIAAPPTGRLLPDDLGLHGPSTPQKAVHTATLLWEADPRAALPPVPTSALRAPVRRWRHAAPSVPPQRTGAAGRVGHGDIARIHAVTEHLALLDNRFGGGAAQAIALTHLRTDVLPLLEGSYAPSVGRPLFRAAALVTHHTAHLLYDTGRHSAARRYLCLALDMAHQADDRGLAAKILGTLAHQAVYLGDYREAVDFTEAGLAESGLTPAGRAVLHAMAARAHAGLGDAQATAVALTRAERSLSASRPDHEPTWLRYFNSAELHDEIAHCLVALRQGRAARPHAEHGIAARTIQYARSVAFTRIVLATAHLQQREVEQACNVALGALRASGDIDSNRVRGYLAGFNERLRPFHKVPAARDFSHRATRMLR